MRPVMLVTPNDLSQDRKAHLLHICEGPRPLSEATVCDPWVMCFLIRHIIVLTPLLTTMRNRGSPQVDSSGRPGDDFTSTIRYTSLSSRSINWYNLTICKTKSTFHLTGWTLYASCLEADILFAPATRAGNTSSGVTKSHRRCLSFRKSSRCTDPWRSLQR